MTDVDAGILKNKLIRNEKQEETLYISKLLHFLVYFLRNQL